MINCLENYKTSDSLIDDFTIYALDPSSYQFKEKKFTKFFTTEQIDAIIDFLKFAVENDDFLDADVAKKIWKIFN